MSAAGVLVDGKDAEAEVVEVFEELSRANKLFSYHRYPDSRSASRGGKLHLVAAQPSDYIISYRTKYPDSVPNSFTYHIEVKESAQQARIALAKIRQYGMLKKFWWAGITPIVLVKCTAHGDWVVFTSSQLFPDQSPYERDESLPPKSFAFSDGFHFATPRSAILTIMKVAVV